MNDDSAWFARMVAEEAEKRRRALWHSTASIGWGLAVIASAGLLVFLLAGCHP